MDSDFDKTDEHALTQSLNLIKKIKNLLFKQCFAPNCTNLFFSDFHCN